MNTYEREIINYMEWENLLIISCNYKDKKDIEFTKRERNSIANKIKELEKKSNTIKSKEG